MNLIIVLPYLLSQVIYTERYESKRDHSTSSVNLIRCSRLESGSISQISSDDQMPYAVSSTFLRNQGQTYETVEKEWLSNEPSRSLPDATPSQVRSRALVPYSESFLLPSTHTIILDFSMVHFVDSRALVILRQVRSSPTPPPQPQS